MSFIPLAIPNTGATEAQYLQQCIDENFISSVGEFVNRFEKDVGTLSGSGNGVAMGAGTQALQMALHSLGIGQGDLVILPSFTFIASANAISHCNAKPWLFDINPENWTLDTDQVRKALQENTEKRAKGLFHKETGARVAGIMPVYTLGTPANMVDLKSLAKEYNLPIIADAAAAIGLSYHDKPLADWADLTCFSFNGNKTITCGGGGMVVGHDQDLLARIKHLSTTARVSANYEHDEIGFNFRMTNLQAAVGCAQLERLDKFLERKRSIRRSYEAAFEPIAGISGFPDLERTESTAWFSGFVLEDKALPGVSEICKHLRDHQIEARPFWKPVHLQQPYADAPKEKLTQTDSIWHRIVTLPCSTTLTDTEQNKVIDCVTSLLANPTS